LFEAVGFPLKKMQANHKAVSLLSQTSVMGMIARQHPDG
jgi:hypothetical protein